MPESGTGTMLLKMLKAMQLENRKLICKNAELAECLRLLSNELENEISITDLIDKIRESSDLDATLSIIVNEITDITKSYKCIIYLLDTKTQSFKEFRIQEDIGSVPENLELNSLFNVNYKSITAEDDTFLIENIDFDSLNNLQKQYFFRNKIKSLMITPIMSDDEILGLIFVHRNDLMCDWNDSHSESLRKFSKQAASSIKKTIIYDRLAQEAKIKKSISKDECKNHITSLIGFSELLLNRHRESLSEEKQKQYLTNIVESTDLLNKVLNDMCKKL